MPDIEAEEIEQHDMGCVDATAYLGKQSHCLECPFDKCILEEPLKAQLKHRRNEEIKCKARKGATEVELAEQYGVSLRTIQRVLSSK